MEKIWIVATKELRSFFDSLIAYILLAAFLGFSGFFTWMFGNDVFLMGQASLQSFFNTAYFSLFFFIPALTMKMIAEEKKTGTIELLLTKPVTDGQVVIGKFLACLILIGIALLFTLPYYLTIANIGQADHGAIISGYIGLILMSSAYISIGLFCSSFSNNQIVAFLIALFIGLFFHFIFGMLASLFSGAMGDAMIHLSTMTHFESLARGVIDSKDIVFFLSLTALGLFGAQAMLSKRNLAD